MFFYNEVRTEQLDNYLTDCSKNCLLYGCGLFERSEYINDGDKCITNIRKEGDIYLLNGIKNFVSFAMIVDRFVLLVHNDDLNCYSWIFIDSNQKGVSIKDLKKRNFLSGELEFNNVELKENQILVDKVDTFVDYHYRLHQSFVNMEIINLSYKKLLDYSKHKISNNELLIKKQNISFKLVDILFKYEIYLDHLEKIKNKIFVKNNIIISEEDEDSINLAKAKSAEFLIDVINNLEPMLGIDGYIENSILSQAREMILLFTLNNGNTYIIFENIAKKNLIRKVSYRKNT
jgi:alkylation response protein AidB-like acyl-CoA dehydrogenase